MLPLLESPTDSHTTNLANEMALIAVCIRLTALTASPNPAVASEAKDCLDLVRSTRQMVREEANCINSPF